MRPVGADDSHASDLDAATAALRVAEQAAGPWRGFSVMRRDGAARGAVPPRGQRWRHRGGPRANEP
jgi:hypothetical protein